MRMKKIMAIIMALILTASMLTACGSADKQEEPAANEETVKEAPSEALDTEEETQPAEETAAPEETAESEENETDKAGEPAEEEKTGSIADYVPGTWEDTVYTNETLGIQMEFPETFTIFSGDMLDELMGQTLDTVTENSDIKNVNEEALKYDFMAVASDQIGNIILTIEENPQGLTAEEYLDALLQSFELAGVPCEVIQEKGSTSIGETDFVQIGLMLDYSSMTGIEGNTTAQAYMIHADDNLVYYFLATLAPDSAQEIGTVMDGIAPLA